MITNLSPASQAFLNGLDIIQQGINTASEQVSSGLKLNVASDDPDVIGAVLQLRANIAQNNQILTNLSTVQTEANTAGQVLESATELMDQAVSLATEGANSDTTPSQDQALAEQVQNILEQMVNYSVTNVGGRYIFGGDDDQSPPYQLDLSSGNGVDQLTTAAATRQIQDPAGGTFAVDQTAQQIFDDRNPDGTYASDNVFASLNNLLVALQNNDSTAVDNSVASLQAANAHLNNSLSFYGSVQDRLQSATDYANNNNVQLQTQLSNEQDADVTSAALELTQGNTQLQAAYSMEAKLPTQSLFSYLPPA
jgi:flagellar hook-associated protein 3 FlgL